MTSRAWATVAALSVGAGAGAVFIQRLPTRDICRGTDRIVDPTGRHCLSPEGPVQLREHVLGHTVEAVVITMLVAGVATMVYRLRRPRRINPIA